MTSDLKAHPPQRQQCPRSGVRNWEGRAHACDEHVWLRPGCVCAWSTWGSSKHHPSLAAQPSAL
eukprot:750539-Alexandrium_andersonii.AAC.1